MNIFINEVYYVSRFAHDDFLANITVPHYAAGLTTYTPDGDYLIGTPVRRRTWYMEKEGYEIMKSYEYLGNPYNKPYIINHINHMSTWVTHITHPVHSH